MPCVLVACWLQALIKAGADMEAKDRQGLTALQVSLLAGWQNISGGHQHAYRGCDLQCFTSIAFMPASSD
jgi:hypothetical protein